MSFPTFARRVSGVAHALPTVKVVLRTKLSQIAVMFLGWLLLTAMFVIVDPLFPVLSIVLSGAVFVYLGWSYPLVAKVDPQSILVRSLFRRRRIGWEDVVAIRRTRGPLRRQDVGGRRRLRPSPGALIVVLENSRSVLLSGHTESQSVNWLLAGLVSQVSPALGDALRFAESDAQ